MSDSPRPGSRRRRPSTRRGAAGFDRIKRPGARAGDTDAARTSGRSALFGDAPGAPVPPTSASPEARRTLPVAAVHCSSCDATSPLDVLTALRGSVPLFVVPWADHPWWAPCPACGERAWLRPQLLR